MMHKRSLHKKHKITAQTLRRMIERTHKQCIREHKRTRLRGRGNSRRRGAESDPSVLLVTPLPHLYHSVPSTSRHTRIYRFESVVLVGLTWLHSIFVLGFHGFASTFTYVLIKTENIWVCVVNRTIFSVSIIFLRRINPKLHKPKKESIFPCNE